MEGHRRGYTREDTGGGRDILLAVIITGLGVASVIWLWEAFVHTRKWVERKSLTTRK